MVIGDYPNIQKIWQECELSEESEDSYDEIEDFLKSPQGTGFVAVKNGNIVGAVLCGSDGRYGYIHHLCVSNSLRRQGIGKRLVEECLCFLQRRHVVIMVRNTNEAAKVFWNQMHFQNADWLKVQYCEILP